MKLHVDTTLPPQQFQAALIIAARRARAEHEFIRVRAAAYVASGWDADIARDMALADLAIQQGALQ
jgi:hypothetical protein